MTRQIIAGMIALFFISCGTRISGKLPLSYSNKMLTSPEIFAEGVIVTPGRSVFNVCFSPDGRNVYFTGRTGQEKQKIWRSTFVGNSWTKPEVCPFSTDRDENPFITPDGKTLYFGSTRPITGRPTKGNFDMNIWKVNWDGKDWANPVAVGSEINAVQQEKEEWPSSNESFIFTNDNVNFLYSSMIRGTKTIDIFKTSSNGNAFSNSVNIDGLFGNENPWKSSAIISPDGNYLLFNAYGAESGFGGEDIFISKKTSTGWSKAKNIGAIINTKTEEACPRFSPDGNYFFFAREIKENADEDGIWKIYFMETKFLRLETLFNN